MGRSGYSGFVKLITDLRKVTKMSELITDTQIIKSLVEKGVTECPSNVDPNLFAVFAKAYGTKPQPVVEEAAPWENATPAGQTNALNAVTIAGGVSAAVALPSDGNAFSLDDFENSGSAVDGWISVSNGVFKLKGEAISMPADGIKCVLHGENTKFAKGIRSLTKPGDANSYHYFKTYNGRVTADGMDWAGIVTAAKNSDANAFVYDLVELELELAEPVMDVRGKKIVADKGAVIGFGNAPTGAKYMREFNSQLKSKGFTLSSSDVPCVLKGRLVERKAGNPYQIIVAEAR